MVFLLFETQKNSNVIFQLVRISKTRLPFGGSRSVSLYVKFLSLNGEERHGKGAEDLTHN